MRVSYKRVAFRLIYLVEEAVVVSSSPSQSSVAIQFSPRTLGGKTRGIPAPTANMHACGGLITAVKELSGDRRVVDEALAAQFLQVFRNYLSNPKSMLL